MFRDNILSSIGALAALFARSPSYGQYPFIPPDPSPRAGRKVKTRSGVRSAKAIATDPIQSSVNRLTNWQRNQWARDGYKRDKVSLFLTLEHPKRRARAAKAA